MQQQTTRQTQGVSSPNAQRQRQSGGACVDCKGGTITTRVDREHGGTCLRRLQERYHRHPHFTRVNREHGAACTTSCLDCEGGTTTTLTPPTSIASTAPPAPSPAPPLALIARAVPPPPSLHPRRSRARRHLHLHPTRLPVPRHHSTPPVTVTRMKSRSACHKKPGSSKPLAQPSGCLHSTPNVSGTVEAPASIHRKSCPSLPAVDASLRAIHDTPRYTPCSSTCTLAIPSAIQTAFWLRPHTYTPCQVLLLVRRLAFLA